MLSNTEDITGFGKAIAEAVSVALGESFEVILYDMGDPEHPVLEVYGKDISGLKKGDSGQSENFNSSFTQCAKEGRIYRSERKIINGQEMQSTIIFLTKEGKHPAAVLRILFSMSPVSVMEGFLRECGLLNKEGATLQDVGDLDLRNVLSQLLKKAIQLTGKEVAAMGKEDKLKIVEFLDQRGAFLLRSSIEDVARALDISRFTVYNYLDEIRQV